MVSIPAHHWKTKSGKTATFSEFVLDAKDDVAKKLATSLGAFSFGENAKTVLALILTDKIDQNQEAYQIQIDQGRIAITSASVNGLHFGLATLKILLFSGGNTLELGCIQDAPAFANRGIMLDVSRGKMPTLAYLKNLVGLMSDLKYNILQLYCEDKLALKSHPAIGELTGKYTEDQIRELDAYCQQRFIQLQPCLQTYSHMHGVLRTPGYSHLAENQVLFSLAAGNEAVYDFLEDEFRETLPWFSNKTLNINMDEAYDIGTGFSKEAVERKGKGKVFMDHIHRVVDIARKHGAKTIILWGDVAGKYPELLPQLPPDTIVADWNYNPLATYPCLEKYEVAKIRFWASGGVATWNSIFPRMYNTYVNLIGYSNEAFARGATGFLVTDWGDYGHLQPLGLSLYGYLVGAQQAFWAQRITPEYAESLIWPLIFCDRRMEEAFRLLMNSNLAPGMQTDFKTMSIYYFFDDMLDGLAMNGNARYPKLHRESFDILWRNGTAASELLQAVVAEKSAENHLYPDENWQALFGMDYGKELRLSARMTAFTGQKGRVSFQIKDTLKKEDVTVDDILGLILQIKRLYQEFIQIRREFEVVWRLRADDIGIDGCLTIFDKAGLQLAQTVKWLAIQQTNLASGQPVDATLATYTAAKDHGVLWTSDFKNMWDRAYPWQ